MSSSHLPEGISGKWKYKYLALYTSYWRVRKGTPHHFRTTNDHTFFHPGNSTFDIKSCGKCESTVNMSEGFFNNIADMASLKLNFKGLEWRLVAACFRLSSDNDNIGLLPSHKEHKDIWTLLTRTYLYYDNFPSSFFVKVWTSWVLFQFY